MYKCRVCGEPITRKGGGPRKYCYTHGKGGKMYGAWHGMIARCYRGSHSSYPYYGGKGIRVYEPWRIAGGLGFIRFARWMLNKYGEAEKHKHIQLGRVDDGKNYIPSNIQGWVTARENQRNRKISLPEAVVIEACQVIQELADKYDIKPGSISNAVTSVYNQGTYEYYLKEEFN